MSLPTPVASGEAPTFGPLTDRFGRVHTYMAHLGDRSVQLPLYLLYARGGTELEGAHELALL